MARSKIAPIARRCCAVSRAAILSLSLCACGHLGKAAAEEITLLFSGETHAMLYQCSCPKEVDGGIARRATLVKQLRKAHPLSLLLDSGGFSAGGLLDEYTQNTQLDQERTRIQRKAMDLMKYDAAALGDDEFNFGKEFLEASVSASSVPLLSCNIVAEREGAIKPYIVKEVGAIKTGIIGVTSLSAQQKAGGLTFTDPVSAVQNAVAQLKGLKVNFIILLSHLGENEDIKLIAAVPDIDVLIVGHSRANEEVSGKIASTLVLRPAWQGRRLGKAILTIKNDSIIDSKVEELRLSDTIADDREILTFLPRCFADSNCRKEAMIGSCQNQGSMGSQCVFTETVKVPLTIITSKDCSICDTERVAAFLKKQFPGLASSTLFYPEPPAKAIMKELAIGGLPAYLLGKEVERDRNFDTVKQNTELKGNYYMLKSQFSGFSYFPERKKVKGRIDLFVSLFDKTTPQLLDAIKDFEPAIHFLAVPQAQGFDAGKGQFEAEECLRAVCVQKYYPKDFWEYISCRSRNNHSSWWDQCLPSADADLIKGCAVGKEGRELLIQNTSLNNELQVMFGPTYLTDNQEIFGTSGAPTKEDFKKIFKR